MALIDLWPGLHRQGAQGGRQRRPQQSYLECIGRYLEAGSFDPRKGNENGCDWCAYGLFGTAGKGRLVEAEDGCVVDVFQFAEAGHE